MMSAENLNIPRNEKSQLRRLALSKRDALDTVLREEASAEIAKRLLSLLEMKAAKTVMCYKSFRSEVSTAQIIKALEKQGKKLCFPVCGKAGIMQAWNPQEDEAWKTGMMGISEPDVEKSELICPEEIDIVICPMVAFDEKKWRMGYGGGYYDRYLPKCTKALKIGIAFEAQRLDKVPVDEFDQPMDYIVTEEKVY
ncbi:MAG: 5-formyltetrahydrofolate cyclo-ligase [Oscillospiraceae bacterium]|nr:5-formyltetrahydrofolate cyclo-ligase [Oscillospiraceae bacterium]